MEKPIYVTRASLPPMEEYIALIRELWDSHWLTNMGELHDQLEKELAAFLGVPYLSLFCNGHMALELTLQAFGLNGEVITTPYSFASTTHAIVRNGLVPVFADVEPGHCTLDPERIEALLTARTCAILPVHVYGYPCEVDAIQEIADRHGLKVIYDAAHAFGVERRVPSQENPVGIGRFGDAAVFSFHATKVFHTIEGGAAAFADPELMTRLYQLKNFGIMDPEHVEAVGANAKMHEFSAAMGLANLRHVPKERERRRRLQELYRQALRDVPGLVMPHEQEEVLGNGAYLPVFVQEKEAGLSRDVLADRLAEEKIYVRKYFYPLISAYACYEGILDPGDTPVARRASEEVMTLPLYPELSDDEVLAICATIRRLIRDARNGGNGGGRS